MATFYPPATSAGAVLAGDLGTITTLTPTAVTVADNGPADGLYREALRSWSTSPQPTFYRDRVLATPNVVGYWRLGEASGTAAANEVSGAPAGTYTSASAAGGYALGATGAIAGTNKALSLLQPSATQVGFVDLGSISTYDFVGNAAFSLEAWIQPTTLDANSRRIIWNRSSDASGNQGWEWYIGGAVGQLQLARYLNSASQGLSSTASIITTAGAWFHVVSTWSGSIAAHYINGVARGATTIGSPSSIIAAPTPVRIGSVGGTSSASDTTAFKGGIDEVAIYSRALTAAEALDHYNAGVQGYI